MIRTATLAAFAAIAILASDSDAAIITIGSNSASVSPFGSGSDANHAYGQVITVPVGDDTLVSYSLSLAGISPVAATVFRSEVYEWNGASVTGSALYTSGSVTAFSPGPYTFSPGVSVNAGTQYIFTLIAESTPGPLSIPANDSNPYSGGAAWVLASPSSDPVTGSWSELRGVDLVGEFTFSGPAAAVPEPATLAIWSLGALGCAVAGYRRREKSRLVAGEA